MTFQQELQNSQKEWYTHGKKDGVEEGVKQGKEQTTRTAVFGMYNKGITIPDIADILNLKIEEVEKILSSDLDDSNENMN